ncbi:uncharacterized protein LOC111380343 [Olea europaea var. sylvestris]|uniref:Photosystem I reaction centre subunit N n=1 Tax=Olea europaea subsp. europaea TaxID=158383 RepID=A0A8S0TPV6_OLEEU|nr:uncharacterized protein LOC111380343 [Olea europaea var. sylvestris]CAA3007914.1 photosystem I reaction centre subunit N [Olea europaea subsp. europaea]
MAISASFRPLISFKVEAYGSRESRERTRRVRETGRREILLSTVKTAAVALVTDSKTQLLDEYLKKSQENKAKNDKERLDSYYKRNYRDYFGLLEGSLKQKTDLSESEKGILEWLESNK